MVSLLNRPTGYTPSLSLSHTHTYTHTHTQKSERNKHPFPQSICTDTNPLFPQINTHNKQKHKKSMYTKTMHTYIHTYAHTHTYCYTQVYTQVKTEMTEFHFAKGTDKMLSY